MKSPALIEKPLGLRLSELALSAQLLEDSIVALQRGDVHFVLSLASQLRMLLTERSKGAEPLLLALADKFRVDTTVYSGPDVTNDGFPEELLEGLLFRIGGLPVTTAMPTLDSKGMPLVDFLDHGVVALEGESFSPRRVIEFFANKLGGAHSSLQLPLSLAQVQSVEVLGLPGLTPILVQTAAVAKEIALRVLRRVSDFEIYFSFVLLDETAHGRQILLDSVYPGSAMRMFIGVDPGPRLIFYVKGFDGRSALLSSREPLDWREPHWIRISHLAEDDVHSRLQMHVDGIRMAEMRVPWCFVAPADPRNYDVFINRVHGGEGPGSRFGVGELVMYGVSQNPFEVSQTNLYFMDRMEQEEHGFSVFGPETHGHMPRGTSDLAIHGPLGRVSRRELVKGTTEIENWEA